jgi:hypothetical protein
VEERDDNDKVKMTLMFIRKKLEFGVYFYVVMATSLFLWLCAVNEVAARRFDTILNICSYSVALFMLIFLFALMLFPVVMLFLESRVNKVDVRTNDEVAGGEEIAALSKIWDHYRYGLRKAILAQLFYTTTQLKYL